MGLVLALVGCDADPAGCPWGACRAGPNPWDPAGAVLTVDAAAPTELRATWVAEGASHRSTAAAAGPGHLAEIPVRGLPTGERVDLVPTDGVTFGEGLPVELPPLPAGFPTGQIEHGDGQGVWCLDGSEGRWFCVDAEGRPGLSLAHPDGRPLFVVQPLASGFAALGPGEILLFDAVGRNVARVSAEDWDGQTRFVHDSVDRHELIALVDGPWAGAIAVLTVTDDGGVRANGIVVLDPASAEVLWDWQMHGALGDGVSIDPVRLPFDRIALEDPGADWAHGNALLHAVDGDGDHFWLSLRNQDWIVRVDVADDRVRWRLGFEGDFTLVGDGGWFFHQHAPSVVDRDGPRTTLLVYDNGNVRVDASGDLASDPPWSRVVELVVDEDRGEAAVSWSWGSPDPGDPTHFYSAAQGSARPLPDGAVGVLQQDGGDALLLEVERDGSVRRKERFPGQTSPYRAIWMADFYP